MTTTKYPGNIIKNENFVLLKASTAKRREEEEEKKNYFLCASASAAKNWKDKFVFKRVNKGCRTTLFVFYSCTRDEMPAKRVACNFSLRALKDINSTAQQKWNARDNFIAQERI